MKKYLYLLTILLLTNFSCSKQITKKENVKPEPILVELLLNEKPEGFIWKKGAYLDLSGKITNKSKIPITILTPSLSSQAYPEYFSVHFIEDFEGLNCEYEVSVIEEVRRNNDFITILPNQSKDIYISGRSKDIKYCNQVNSDKDEVKLNISYYGKKHNYTCESNFIAQNYKTKINAKDSLYIQSKLESFANSSLMQKLNEEKRITCNFLWI